MKIAIDALGIREPGGGRTATLNQLQALLRLAVAAMEHAPAGTGPVVLMDVDYDKLIKRISGRRSCTNCGRVFNIHTAPPPPEGCCAASHLVQRPDDKEETVAKRLQVYDEQTKPLVAHYTGQGLLRMIDADAEMAEVTQRLEAALVERSGEGLLVKEGRA